MHDIHYLRRQITGFPHQSTLFVLCVALSLVTLISLSGFSRSVHASLLRDARALHAADIIIDAHYPFSPTLTEATAVLERENKIEIARIFKFYSVVRAVEGEGSLLADVKVVEPGYPFYGTVRLASGRPLSEVLTRGNIAVDQALLDRLHLHIGDRLHVGSAVLAIRDVVLQEPDRPVAFFALGPRIFVAEADRAALDLIGKGSRVNYTLLVKVNDERELDHIAGVLRQAALKDRELVSTYRTAQSGVKTFFDNFLFFLNLIAIFTLLLAGSGIQSSVSAFLREQERTIAVMKAVGARSRFIITHYFGMVFVLGLIGTLISLGASLLFEKVLPVLFRGLLPPNTELTISGAAVVEGIALGFVVVVLFTVLPLYRLKEVRPRAILGREEAVSRARSAWLAGGMAAVLFLVLVIWRIGDARKGILFSLAMGALILVSFLCADAALRIVQKIRTKRLIFRQALKGLFRPGNATRVIMVTLIASLVVIFSIRLVEGNLDATFVRAYPADAPNLFFIDIQPAQKDSFARDLGRPALFYPVVRGTVTAINNEPVNAEEERKKRGDNLGREFNLTYRGDLLEDEQIVSGTSLFRSDWPEAQVSVLDTVLNMHTMHVGDTITFNIQGVPVQARISSLRTRTRASIRPFFYFVFPEQVLKDAPRTFFTALRVEKAQLAPLQDRIAAHFPNISIIDVSETISLFSRFMERLSMIVRFFTLFSVAAGFLIIISSVFATRRARIQEAVYFTVLGARSRFVLSVFAAENLLLGLMSSGIALALSQAGSWTICRKVIDVPYRPFLGTSALMVFATTFLVVAVGLGASLSIVRQKPAAFLREQSDE